MATKTYRPINSASELLNLLIKENRVEEFNDAVDKAIETKAPVIVYTECLNAFVIYAPDKNGQYIWYGNAAAIMNSILK